MGVAHGKRRLGLLRRAGRWWITNVPEYYVDGDGPFYSCGPYDTKQEAEEGRNSMQGTLKEIDNYTEEYEYPVSKEQAIEEETIERQEVVYQEEGFW